MKTFPLSIRFLSRSVLLSLAMIAGIAHAQTGEVFCPVLHKKGLPQYGAHYFGGLIFLICCEGCDREFKEHPFQFLEEGEALGKPVAESLFDPIDGKRVISGSTESTEYRGIRYVFNSAEHLTEFKANPELYVEMPRSEVRWDLKTGREIAYPDAIRYVDYTGIRVYFSDPAALESFQSDPAEAYAQLKTHLKNLEPKDSTAPKRDRTLAPTCAGCAGEARLLGPDGLPAKWTISYRYVNIKKGIENRHRWSIDHAITPKLTVGLERAGGDDSNTLRKTGGLFGHLGTSDGDSVIMPRASWFVTPETDEAPSVVLGFASDRLTTSRGQAIFLTGAKTIKNTPFTPFASVKYNTSNRTTLFPYGLNIQAAPDWTIQGIYDGDYSHFLLTYMKGQSAYSFLLAKSKYPGFAISYGF